MGAEPKRILLVDDEEDLVWSIKSRLAKAMPDVVVDGVSQPELAIRWLGERRYDLVVSDIRMPRISGIELLIKARSLYPTLPFIIVTAFPSEQGQREAMRLGSVTYVEKPFQMDALIESIAGLLTRAASGFSGALQLETLPDLVQLFTLSNTTGVLRIWESDREGRIWFDRGAIIAAKAGPRSGVDAFNDILLWSAGQFSMERHVALPERTIFESPAALLIEAFRLYDEAKRESGRSPAREEAAQLETESGFDAPVDEVVSTLRGVSGYLGFCIVDGEGHGLIETDSRTAELDVSAAGLCNIDVLETQKKTVDQMGIEDGIEDMVITVSSQFHLLRPIPETGRFLYLVVDRRSASLATARMALREAHERLAPSMS